MRHLIAVLLSVLTLAACADSDTSKNPIDKHGWGADRWRVQIHTELSDGVKAETPS